jgi:hypothetical protein
MVGLWYFVSSQPISMAHCWVQAETSGHARVQW